MITKETEAEILRLHHAETWRIGTIATQLGVHHSTVRRVLAQAGLDAGRVSVRPSMADPYVPFIEETLKQYPRLRASRLFEMVKARGYPGKSRSLPDDRGALPSPSAGRSVPARAHAARRAGAGRLGALRQAPHRPGCAGPVGLRDGAVAGRRRIFLRFYLSAAMPSFVRGHVEAFDFFGGVPRVLLYDNLKSAVLERAGDAIRFHPTLLELSAHYHFLPRPVAPARGNEKGRVERAIRYVRDSFFAARTFTDLDDLNAQALAWTEGIAADRPCPEDWGRTVRELFAEERGKLLALPDNPYPTEERVVVEVGKTPYVRFDQNDYSIPHTHVRRSLVVLATPTTVRVLDPGTEAVLSTHARSWDRDQQIEDPSHIEALVEHKRAGKEHRAIDRLHAALPHSRALLVAIAERGGNLGSATLGALQAARHRACRRPRRRHRAGPGPRHAAPRCRASPARPRPKGPRRAPSGRAASSRGPAPRRARRPPPPALDLRPIAEDDRR